MTVNPQLWTLCACYWPYAVTGPKDSRVKNGEDFLDFIAPSAIGVELLPDEASVISARARGIPILNHLPDLGDDPAFRVGLCDPDPAQVRRALDAYEAAIKIAAPGEKVIVFTGVVPPDKRDGGERERLVNNLREIVKIAEAARVTLVLEHLNDKPASDDPDDMTGHKDYVGSDIGLVARSIKEVGSDYLGMLFDVYHVMVQYGEWEGYLEDYFHMIRHIHVAGVLDGRASRVEPTASGQEIDIDHLCEKLTTLRYKFGVGLEYLCSDSVNHYDGLSAVIDLFYDVPAEDKDYDDEPEW